MWWRAILSAFFAFILETQLDKVITNLVETLFGGSPLFIVIANTLSFLAIFSLLFAVFNKVFGSHGNRE